MAESENIGSVSVSIVGDYSRLEGDIDKATQIAADGGKEIADALNQGADGADALSSALAGAVASAASFDEQVQALVDSGSTLAEALEQVDASLLPIEADASASAEALDNMAASTKEVATASKDAAPAVEGVAKSTNSLVGELTSMAAKAGIVVMLYEMGKAALEAADEVGDAALAMGLLSGNAEEAARTVEQLRDVANDAALGLPELLTAATRMTAFLGSSKDVADVLRTVADSAAVMHVSLAAASGGFERIVASGDLSQRSLQRLGLTMDDMAEVMGVSGPKMKEAFEGLDQSARMEVMIAAMGKFKGAAEKMSDDSIGAVQRMKNKFFEMLESIGTAIEPVINALAKVASALMDSFARQAVAISAAVKSAIEGAKALMAAISGNYGEAINHFQAMTAAWAKGNTDLAALALNQQKVNTTVAEGTRLTDAEIKAQVKASLARRAGAESAKHLQEVLESLSKTAKDFASQLPASYEAYTAKLIEGGKTAQSVLSGTEESIRKANLAMEGMRGKPLAAMQEVVVKLTELHARAKEFAAEDLWNKQAQEIAAFANKYKDELGSLDASTLDWVNMAMAAARDVPEALNKITDAKFFGDWAAAMAKMTVDTAKAFDETAKLIAKAEAGTRKFTESMLEAIPITVSFTELVGESVAAFLDMQEGMNKVGMQATQQIESQISGYEKLLVEMTRLNQPIGQRLELQAKILQKEIELKELTGASATSQILGLEQIRLKQDALYDSTHAFGELVVGVERAIWKGWNDVFLAIGDVILEGKNFGQAMEEIGKRVAKMIVDQLANYAFKMLKSAIIGVDVSVKDLDKSLGKMIKTVADAFKPIKSGVPGTPGVGGGGGLSGALDMAGSIASIASAISSIFGNFQMAAMNKSLDLLVQHTLRIFNVMDQWYVASQAWHEQTFTRLGEIWRDMIAGFELVAGALGGGKAASVVPPFAVPPLPPGIPGVAQLGGPGEGTYSSSTQSASSIVGGITFNVSGANDPRETARQIAETLKRVSPNFAAYS